MFLTIKTKKTSKSIALSADSNIVRTHYTSESGTKGPDGKFLPKLTVFLSDGKAEEFGGAATIEGVLEWLDQNSTAIIGGDTVAIE